MTDAMATKLEEAKKYLGTKWILHPDNRVQKVRQKRGRGRPRVNQK